MYGRRYHLHREAVAAPGEFLTVHMGLYPLSVNVKLNLPCVPVGEIHFV